MMAEDDLTECRLRFIEAILAGIKGETAAETRELRASWVMRNLPMSASLLGIDKESTR